MIPDLDKLGTALSGAVLGIAEAAKAGGGRAMMVGGSVRDLIAGRDAKDVDIEVFGIPAARLRGILSPKFEFDECGASFGVLKTKHLDIDISMPRRESKTGAGHRAFDIASDPFLSVEEAASRRDFTINAIYLDPLSGKIEDPFGGLADIESKTLRHVSGKFREDPLRVLRGMQFAARFNLSAAPETIAICREMDIEGLPPERLFGEWSKLLLKGREISRGLKFLRETRWIRFFPELEALPGVEQDPEWHPEGDVWNHTCLCMDAFAKHRTGDAADDIATGLAVLCHDFGKPYTTVFDRGRYRSPGHDAAGVKPTLSFLSRLTNEERLLKEVPPLVACHMQPFALWRSGASEAAVRRLSVKVGRIDRLVRVAQADAEGSLCAHKGNGEEFEWLLAMAKKLDVEKSRPKPLLMGRHLMSLGYAPSVKFKKWLDCCYEAQLDGAFADTEGAIEYFKNNVEK